MLLDQVKGFIDDLANTSEANRIWCDGMGFAIPEPATVGLIGILGAGVVFVRRRFAGNCGAMFMYWVA